MGRFDVFVSYRRLDPDRSWVTERLVPRLRAASLRVCLDEAEFRAGQALLEVLEDASYDSLMTLVVLSERYGSSPSCRLEADMAHDVVVVRLDSTPVSPAWRVTRVFDIDLHDEAAIASLADALQHRLGRLQ